MKKSISISVVMFLFFSVVAVPERRVFAADPPVSIYLNGVRAELDTLPVFQNDRVLIPLRGVLENLGALIDWNPQTKQVIIRAGGKEILLGIDKEVALFDGQAFLLDSPSRLMESRTMIPIRFVAELLGCKVTWDQESRRIDICSEPGSSAPDTDQLPVVGSKKVLMELLEYSETIYDYINSNFLITEPISRPVTDQATEQKSANGYSGTNNQVEGVEEGDVIKTDGENIYLLNRNSVLVLTSDPKQPELLSRILFDDQGRYARDLYIDSDKLVIIGGSRKAYPYPDGVEEAQTEGFICRSCLNSTFVQIFDISDPGAPILLYDMDFEGYLVSARVISDKLYFSTNKDLNYSILKTSANGENEEYLEYLLKPKYTDNLSLETVILDFDEIRYFPDHVTPGFVLTVGVDLETGKTDVDPYLGRAESVYASRENMYLALSRYEYFPGPMLSLRIPAYDVYTNIYRFTLKDGEISFASKGKVPGRILNQFSLDEYNGNLRVAVTQGDLWDQRNLSSNSIYILDRDLSIVGELTGLAAGERIYSSRFDNDRIHLVTFREVDPFFVIDASDPVKPTVLGYLKIPGFSTYLHMLGENHVLGFGTETIEQGGRVTTGGLKLSLFDVTVPESPVEEIKEVIGLAGTSSDIQYDHKSLMIDITKGIMAFPVSVAAAKPYHIDYTGAYVYSITDSSFEFLGGISHQSERIHRVLYIGEYLYSLSEGKLMVTHIDDMSYYGELIFP